jgi:hypothetical protein
MGRQCTPATDFDRTALPQGEQQSQGGQQQRLNLRGILPRTHGRPFALVETAEGPTLVAGGVRDLSAAQQALATSRGLTPVALEGFHAEKTLIHAAGELGLTPTRGVATNLICSGPGGCGPFLEGLGAVVDGRYFTF